MKTIYAIRDVLRTISRFENEFERTYQINLNEAMLLCFLHNAQTRVTSSDLAKMANLTPSHTSKTIRILEEKGLIARILGNKDRRQMHFVLSQAGKQKVEEIERYEVEIPEIIRKAADMPDDGNGKTKLRQMNKG